MLTGADTYPVSGDGICRDNLQCGHTMNSGFATLNLLSYSVPSSLHRLGVQPWICIRTQEACKFSFQISKGKKTIGHSQFSPSFCKFPLILLSLIILITFFTFYANAPILSLSPSLFVPSNVTIALCLPPFLSFFFASLHSHSHVFQSIVFFLCTRGGPLKAQEKDFSPFQTGTTMPIILIRINYREKSPSHFHSVRVHSLQEEGLDKLVTHFPLWKHK